jgi:5-methylcytosine-specific restriction enzyme A
VFEVGKVYNRDALLDEYGGQRYGGIITPAQHPLIFLQTGSTGRKYGYNDHWDDAGVFHYYGEGQTGDMTFTGGNSAILNHAEDEEELHLFERVGTGALRYVGEMVCSGFEPVDDQDMEGNPRTAIVFQLIPADADELANGDDTGGELASLDLNALRDAADGDPSEESDATVGQRKTYKRSRALKRYVRARAAGTCEGLRAACSFPDPRRRAVP